MAKRVQSASSIKTYIQCPRKYYYHYIEKIPSKPSIHTVRGNIAHSVLEDFFDQDMSNIRSIEQAETQFRKAIQNTLVTRWKEKQQELSSLEMPQEELIQYFEETLLMLLTWMRIFIEKLKKESAIPEGFQKLTPIREKKYQSEEFQVRGFIDAIEDIDGVVRIMDYKTNKRCDIADHRLQLGIYSILYMEEHGRLPDYVGIYFLRESEKTLRADMQLVEEAKKQILLVHEKTGSEEKQDYPLKPSPLCKWRKGQCDFYEHCFGNKKEELKKLTSFGL